MTLTRPYCSLAQLQDHIGNADPDKQDLLESAINRASRFVEDKTGTDFWFHDHSTTALTVNRRDVLGDQVLLPFPIITLTEVSNDGEVLVEGVDNDYFFEVGERAIQGLAAFGSIPFVGTLTVKGTFGYTLDTVDPTNLPPPTIPGTINQAAILIASAYSGLWQKSVRSLTGGTDNYFVQDVPKEALTLLKSFKLVAHRAFA